MWRLLVLGLVVVALDAPAAWYLEDREGTLAASDVACDFFDPEWAHLQIRPNATAGGWDLVVANPTEHDFTFWGGDMGVESWAVRWDGRLEPGLAQRTHRDFPVDHEGTRVPPGGEVVLQQVGSMPGVPGEHVLRAQMEGLCVVARVRVP